MADLLLGVESDQRRRAHQVIARGDRYCDKQLGGCGRTWDPTHCYHCNLPKSAEQILCPKCSRETPLSHCVACGSQEAVRGLSYAEALGLEPIGRQCSSCDWLQEGSPATKCPLCGALAMALLPEEPELSAGLDLDLQQMAFLPQIYAAEGRIAKDQEGIPLDTCLASWLDRHGVVGAEEQNLWEDLIHAVATGHRVGTAKRFERTQKQREDSR